MQPLTPILRFLCNLHARDASCAVVRTNECHYGERSAREQAERSASAFSQQCSAGKRRSVHFALRLETGWALGVSLPLKERTQWMDSDRAQLFQSPLSFSANGQASPSPPWHCLRVTPVAFEGRQPDTFLLKKALVEWGLDCHSEHFLGLNRLDLSVFCVFFNLCVLNCDRWEARLGAAFTHAQSGLRLFRRIQQWEDNGAHVPYRYWSLWSYCARPGKFSFIHMWYMYFQRKHSDNLPCTYRQIHVSPVSKTACEEDREQ